MLNDHIIDAVVRQVEERELEEFLEATETKDEVAECTKLIQQAHSERVEQNKLWSDKARELFCSIKNTANRRQFECTLTYDWILDKIRDGVCERTGIAFAEPAFKGAERHPYAPSLDRIDSSKGYTEENVQVVVLMYNFGKNSFTQDQMDDYIRRIIKNNS